MIDHDAAAARVDARRQLDAALADASAVERLARDVSHLPPGEFQRRLETTSPPAERLAAAVLNELRNHRRRAR